MTIQPYWKVLPQGVALVHEDGKTFIRAGVGWIVTKETGQCKWFRGTDDATIEKASKWYYSFVDGYQEKYEVQS